MHLKTLVNAAKSWSPRPHCNTELYKPTSQAKTKNERRYGHLNRKSAEAL